MWNQSAGVTFIIQSWEGEAQLLNAWGSDLKTTFTSLSPPLSYSHASLSLTDWCPDLCSGLWNTLYSRRVIIHKAWGWVLQFYILDEDTISDVCEVSWHWSSLIQEHNDRWSLFSGHSACSLSLSFTWQYDSCPWVRVFVSLVSETESQCSSVACGHFSTTHAFNWSASEIFLPRHQQVTVDKYFSIDTFHLKLNNILLWYKILGHCIDFHQIHICCWVKIVLVAFKKFFFSWVTSHWIDHEWSWVQLQFSEKAKF